MSFSCVLRRVKHKSVIHTIKEQNHTKAFVVEILPVNMLYLDKKIPLWFFFLPSGSKMVATEVFTLYNLSQQLCITTDIKAYETKMGWFPIPWFWYTFNIFKGFWDQDPYRDFEVCVFLSLESEALALMAAQQISHQYLKCQVYLC